MAENSPNPDQLAKHISAMGSQRKGTRKPNRELVCGDIDIRIARDGTWFYHGSPIGRKRLVKLFSTVLKREPDGTYVLETPVEKGRIQVDDVPFVAVELSTEGAGERQRLTLRTNIDESVTVDAEHPISVRKDPETGHPVPYVLVRDALEARIARPVYYELVALGLERQAGSDHVYGVWSSGAFFPLGEVPAKTTAEAR
jgi:uncharacterized protein